jgi:hypothetical protein
MPGANASGRILNASDSVPISGAVVYEFLRPNNFSVTDNSGQWDLTLGDENAMIGVTAEGYGSAVGNGAGLSGDFFIYRASDPVAIKATAFVKNYLIGTVINVLIIAFLIHLSKRFL